MTFTGAHKDNKDDDDPYVSKLGDAARVVSVTTNEAALDERNRLVSGTPWLFSRPEAQGAFDILVVDEAGQLALADAIACARAADNLVLLGDPLQLAQVSQGSHPPGIGRSVLEHLLGDHLTIPPERGIFLPQSYRMHPAICEFISDAVYEGRLDSVAGNEVNAVTSPVCTAAGCDISRSSTPATGERAWRKPTRSSPPSRRCAKEACGSRRAGTAAPR